MSTSTRCALIFTALLILTASTAGGFGQQSVRVSSPTIKAVVESALNQTSVTRYYDPAYVKLAYPGGDPPADRGVCADVIVRAFRNAGVDLQKEIHEDMKSHFSAYPNKWGARRPDTNIDHRRVPNLMTYFGRMGKAIPISQSSADYKPGDVVAWQLSGEITHIGIVSNALSGSPRRYLMVHNIGEGARLEDVLFSWKIIGHYRYFN